MRQIAKRIAETLEAGSPAVLVTVVKSSGSAPRGAGARMLVTSDGCRGTVGGGAVEFAAEKLAKTLLQTGGSELVDYNLTNDQVADLGMICGGRVTLLFHAMAGGDARLTALFSAAAALTARNVDAWLVYRIADGHVADVGLFDGERLLHAETLTVPEIRPYLWGKPVYQPGEPSYFCDPFMRAGHTYVFGGGHVSQKLVPLLSGTGFSVTVLDDRPEFSNAAVFPTAENCIVVDFDQAFLRLPIGAHDDIVIMTRGHQADYEVLEQALKTEAAYIGCIGSHHKVALTKKRLEAAGFLGEQIQRIHAPIGLAIGAETPEEIAVSVAAEMIQCRAARR